MSSELISKLEENLKSMREWERKPVVEVGSIVIELVKLPARQRKRSVEPEKLALHVRLRDSFRGIFIERFEELDDLMRAWQQRQFRILRGPSTSLQRAEPVIGQGI